MKLPKKPHRRVLDLMARGATVTWVRDGRAPRLWMPASASPLPLNPRVLWMRTVMDMERDGLIQPGKQGPNGTTYTLTQRGRMCAAPQS